MQRRVFGVLAVCLFAAGVSGVSVRPEIVAQESGKVAGKVEKEGEATSVKRVASGDRLPPNYGKIGLGDEQKKRIYDVQRKYDAQVDALEKQIADLKAKETAEVEGVLTPEQLKLLRAVIEDSKKKSAEKKKAAEAKTEGLKKSEK